MKQEDKMITERTYNGKTALKVFAIAIAAVFVGILIFEGVKGTKSTSDKIRVTVYNVGKGDCILVEQEEHAMLIDCGYEDTAPEIVSYLQHLKTEPESIIITHYDKDHVGGAAAFAEGFASADFYLPDYEGSSSYYKALMKSLESTATARSFQRVSQDVSFKLGDAEVEIYASDIEYDGDNDNDCSLVVSVRCENDSYLFTGDLEKEGITAFLAKHTEQWDVIKMPHHGNKKGSIDELLKSVKPSVALITDSQEDPAVSDVLALLRSAGAKVYCTSDKGTYYIKSNGSRRYTFEQAG